MLALCDHDSAVAGVRLAVRLLGDRRMDDGPYNLGMPSPDYFAAVKSLALRVRRYTARASTIIIVTNPVAVVV